ncbi:hypothetical protein V494_05467 [Pseudogymnoascus sp. VKM F-4513 (FW-928)]|nr:hypothetical protein V494_05467 [Pseudogymnoascus sp. VKM F-4513 (FW-928)]
MRHQQQIRLRRRRRPLQRRRVYHVPDLQAAVRGVDLNERHHAHWDALAAAAILGIGADDKVLLGVPSGIEEPVHRVHEVGEHGERAAEHVVPQPRRRGGETYRFVQERIFVAQDTTSNITTVQYYSTASTKVNARPPTSPSAANPRLTAGPSITPNKIASVSASGPDVMFPVAVAAPPIYSTITPLHLPWYGTMVTATPPPSGCHLTRQAAKLP